MNHERLRISIYCVCSCSSSSAWHPRIRYLPRFVNNIILKLANSGLVQHIVELAPSHCLCNMLVYLNVLYRFMFFEHAYVGAMDLYRLVCLSFGVFLQMHGVVDSFLCIFVTPSRSPSHPQDFTGGWKLLPVHPLKSLLPVGISDVAVLLFVDSPAPGTCKPVRFSVTSDSVYEFVISAY